MVLSVGKFETDHHILTNFLTLVDSSYVLLGVRKGVGSQWKE